MYLRQDTRWAAGRCRSNPSDRSSKCTAYPPTFNFNQKFVSEDKISSEGENLPVFGTASGEGRSVRDSVPSPKWTTAYYGHYFPPENDPKQFDWGEADVAVEVVEGPGELARGEGGEGDEGDEEAREEEEGVHSKVGAREYLYTTQHHNHSMCKENKHMFSLLISIYLFSS